MTDTMSRSWLVQRLNKPRTWGPKKVDNPFSFGGGLANGGLSGEAMDLLRPIFSFDYMGAAEFEFGAVPKALNKISVAAHERTLVAAEFRVDLSTVAPHWGDRKNRKQPTGDAPIYLLARRDHADEAAKRIKTWIEGHEELKESTRLARALDPRDDWHLETQGWLELENGFMFFVDRAMWAETSALFGVDVDAEVTA